MVQQYTADLQAFIGSRVGDATVAADLLQEVWYQLSKLEDLTQLKNHKAWLYQVARSKIIDHYRKKMPEWLEDYLETSNAVQTSPFLVDPYTPEEAYWRAEFWEIFYEALEQLPENQRIVFMQHELEGLTLREIAMRSQTNLKTIISRKGYAVRRLRENLQYLFDEFFEN